ncbi:MAG: 3-dehydroquinate dehydratase [Verrucomicrobiota bacterium]|jgi:3-dehydroquinate dehydratase-2|nr:3-dehydroquinate dehydratase [Verrucomicrobiota bacterium]
MKMLNILVLNGPNLNLLGTREPEIYGTETLDSIAKDLAACAETIGGVALEFRQSNAESDLITWIGDARGKFDGIILNPAAFTHTSLALSDAIKAVADAVPAVEVHLSNTHAREEIRHRSLTASGCVGQIMGFKGYGYVLALQALVNVLRG